MKIAEKLIEFLLNNGWKVLRQPDPILSSTRTIAELSYKIGEKIIVLDISRVVVILHDNTVDGARSYNMIAISDIDTIEDVIRNILAVYYLPRN